MADQTITANTNYDDASISGLANGENITINGGVLTIDSDVRHAQQAAVAGSLNISATLGGGVLIDGTKVWQIEFDSSSGNVPTLGTVGVQNCTGGTSGATGEFLGVWASYPASPNTAGGAMPASGLVKFRSKVGTFVDNEVVTLPGGATVTINSATGGRRSWIQVAAENSNNPNIPRLGSFITQGDWFELGTTNGADDQTFAIPVLDHLGVIWVETAVASGVYEKWLNAGCKWGTSTQFVQTDLRGKYFGQWREQAGNATNGSAVVTMASTADFYVGAPVQNVNSTTAATLADGVVINSIVANTSVTVSSNATATAAVTFRSVDNKITIARRASNACGYKPVSGLRVRIPNVWLSNTNTANYAGNALYGSVSTRYEIQASLGGVVDFSECVCNWYINTPNAYSMNIENFAGTNCGGSLVVIGNSPTRNTITNAGFGCEGLQAATVVTISNAFAGLTMTDCRASRAWAGDVGSQITYSLADCADVIMTDCQAEQFEQAAGGTTHGNNDKRAFSLSRVAGITLTRPVCLGGEFYFSDVTGAVITDAVWGDNLSTTTQTTNGITVATLTSFTLGMKWTGLSWFGGGTIANIHPYDYLFSLSSQSNGNRFRSMGTPASPLPATVNLPSGISNVSQSTDNEFNRIYLEGHRTAIAASSASAYRNITDNCWGTPATGGYIGGNDTRLRGCREAMGTTGQSSIYGSHWADFFTGTTTGRLIIAANEPSAASAAQCYVTAGTPKFTGAGSVSMSALGDQLVWEMDYLMLGYTSFANIAPTITGTLTTNMGYEFQWSTGGAWSGTWLTLDAATLSGLAAINPATGIKLKVRATTTTADPTNAITFIRIDLVTDATSQLEVYPFKYDAEGTFPVITTDCRVKIYNTTTSTTIYNEIPGVTNFSYEYYNGTGISEGDELNVKIACKDDELFEANAVASSTGFSILGSLSSDTIYVDNGYDGSAVTGLTLDAPNVEIDADEVDNNISVKEIYAWYKAECTTEDGISTLFGAITAINGNKYRINTAISSIKIDQKDMTNALIISGLLYRDDGVSIRLPGSGSIEMLPNEVYESSAAETRLSEIKAKTDNLPSDPADQSLIIDALAPIAREASVQVAISLSA